MLQPGDLVRFTPDELTYGVDDEGMIGMLGVITRAPERWSSRSTNRDKQFVMVLWPDGKITDTWTDDLTLVQRAHPVVE